MNTSIKLNNLLKTKEKNSLNITECSKILPWKISHCIETKQSIPNMSLHQKGLLTVQNAKIKFFTKHKHSFLQGWNLPFSEGIHLFWVSPSFWSKLKKLPSSFWQPSKLVHVYYMKPFKMKMLHFVLY